VLITLDLALTQLIVIGCSLAWLRLQSQRSSLIRPRLAHHTLSITAQKRTATLIILMSNEKSKSCGILGWHVAKLWTGHSVRRELGQGWVVAL
jgi:hypothetical protein